jgi:glycosyltransferase involved in cell wall biosynthesis
MLPDKKLVSIVAPFYNEAASLMKLLDRLIATTNTLSDHYIFEFVMVDDGSQDNSLDIAKQLALREQRLRVVELRRNYGQTAALQAALDAAQGDIIISMDADLQHFPEDIPLFLDKLEAGNDVVCGWRHQRQEGIARRLPSLVANYLLRKISGLVIHDIGTTFRAYRREIISDMRLISENHRFVPIFASVAGAKIDELPIKNIERPHGQSNYGLARTLNVFIDLFFLYFFVRYLDRPIRIFGKIALATFSVGAIIAVALILLWATTGIPVVRDHSGWFTLSAILLLASVQFLLTGILGEMLARIYFSNKEQTLYKVRNVWTRDNLE